MTETLATRLRIAAKMAGSGDELARRSEIPRRTLENYLSGSAEPKAGNLAKIAEVSGVSLDWLVLGKGEPSDHMAASGQSQAQALPADGFPTVPVYLPELPVMYEGPKGRGSFREHAQPVDNLPVSQDFVRNGLGRSSATGLIAFYVAGRAMEPTLAHGDLVLVDTAQHLSGPGIYAAASEITFLMARMRPAQDGDVEVFVAGQDAPQRFSSAHMAAFEILGRVIWYGRRL